MSGWRLELRQSPALRVDLRGVTPAALGSLQADAVARLTVLHGSDALPLGELFRVTALPAAPQPALHLVGDLSRFDAVGWELDGGAITVSGAVGRHAGALMRAGRLAIEGSAGDGAGCEMAGGELAIGGDAGDFVAGARPGSMDGMRGGVLTVGGRVGERAGDRMRRGLLLVRGGAGDCLGSRMVAGTIAVAGAVGAHPGVMMRRGSLVLLDPPADLPRALGPGFVETAHDIRVFAALLARSLAAHGGPFSELGGRPVRRYAGDIGVDGRGEVITFD